MSFVVMGSYSCRYTCTLINEAGNSGCFIFDSHSRGKDGLGCLGNGTSLAIINVSSFDKAAHFLTRLTRSTSLSSNQHFEIVPCMIKLMLSLDDYLQNTRYLEKRSVKIWREYCNVRNQRLNRDFIENRRKGKV